MSANAESAMHLTTIERAHKQVYPMAMDGRTWSDVLYKEVFDRIRSNQGLKIGRQEHPFNMTAAIAFLNTNEHHSTCIHTKVSATVGLGYKLDQKEKGSELAKLLDEVLMSPLLHVAERERIEEMRKAQGPTPEGLSGMQEVRPASERLTSKVDLVLDPLCRLSWADVLNSIAEDFWQVGNGYLEVVREWPSGKVIALHHVPAPNVFIYIENELYDYHYEIVSHEGGQGCKRFARFGDTKSLMARAAGGTTGLTFDVNEVAARDVVNTTEGEAVTQVVSEIIHFRNPTSHHRWYGMPSWLSAVPDIELCQCLHQFKYDFFLNRGVPEFMLFVLGQKLPKEDWDKIQLALKAGIGLGNTHKSVALNIENPEIKIELEKLALEGAKNDDFAQLKEALAVSIVTAHRVPPLLAGILIPGKLGASNELPNAMAAFQALVVGPAQRIFMQMLGKTLASDDAGLQLKLTDFEFYTILDEINIGQMDTIGRMRQSLPEAQAEGRDLSGGVKD